MRSDGMCVYQNSTPCVGGYALRAPIYWPEIPPWTIRVRVGVHNARPAPKNGTVTRLYDDLDIYDVTYQRENWTQLFYVGWGQTTNRIVEVLGSNTPGVTNMSKLFEGQQILAKVNNLDTSGATSLDYAFYECRALTELGSLDTSNLTSMESMFLECQTLVDVPLFDTSHVTSMAAAFQDCYGIQYLPAFNTSSVISMMNMCYGCTSLKEVPAFSVASLNNVAYAFSGCTAVEHGSLGFYQRASSKSPAPTYYSQAFRNCGSGTASGAAELAQIPSSWK